jgi:hypothetical protein
VAKKEKDLYSKRQLLQQMDALYDDYVTRGNPFRAKYIGVEDPVIDLIERVLIETHPTWIPAPGDNFYTISRFNVSGGKNVPNATPGIHVSRKTWDRVVVLEDDVNVLLQYLRDPESVKTPERKN